MKRKIIFRLSFLIAFLTLLWSCRNEDFIQAEKNPQRNNTDFFRHSKSGGINARGGIDYISILESYNREKNFLSIMPDRQGMPIWDKMQVIDTDNATGLMIPLSHDNETMSSVLFATLDQENSVTGVKDYDNKLLEDIVYNENVDHELRERLFYTFMYMDNKTFGTEQFTGIPKDLFSGKKYDTNYGRIWLKDLAAGHQAQGSTSKMLFIESCGSYWSCKNHESWKNCDHCAACYSTSCSTIMIYIPDEGFPGSTGSSGGGGGGGGGGGTPGPQPPKDPCSLNTVFYRLAPGCGGGGNTDIPDLDDPCEKIKPFITTANAILHNPTVQQKMDAILKGKVSAPNEWAVAVGQNPNGTYEVTSAVEQNATNGSIPSSQLASLYIADGHSHAGNSGNPSGGDLYYLIKGLKTNYPDVKYRYVYGNDGFGNPEVYAFIVNDKNLAFDFLTQFPESENYDPQTHAIKETSELGEEFYKATKHFSEGRSENSTSGENYDSRAIGMAYILDKYNAGISISKVDASGNLKKINVTVEQIVVPYSGGATKEGVKVSKCP